jgi:hypothetical protein
MKELGALIGLGIWIELASDTPIFHRPYKYSDMERDLIRNQTLVVFMGLANYYRRYVKGFNVKGFSAMAKPLNMLLKLDQEWKWGNEQEQAFVEFKAKLVAAPILRRLIRGIHSSYTVSTPL